MLNYCKILFLLLLVSFISSCDCNKKNCLKISQVIGIDNLLEIDKNKPSFLINYKLLFTNKKTKIKQEILSKISEIKDTVKLYFENIKNLTNINNHRFFEKDISDYINELLENGKINRFQILQLIPLKITEN